jgi:ketosteroid isomerase-like protein
MAISEQRTEKLGVERRISRVRQYYRLVDTNDIPGLLALFAENSVYERPGYPTLRGRDEIERFYRTERVIRAGRHTLTTIVANGDSVPVRGEFNGVLRDDRKVEVRFADFFQFDPSGSFANRVTYFFAPQV